MTVHSGSALVTVDEDPALINVHDFGATGDGITDDTAAIQAAIDSAPLFAAVVYFPPGRYVTTGTILINRGSITLRGDGAATQIMTREDGIGIDVGDNVNLLQLFTLQNLVLTRFNIGTSSPMRMRLVAQWRIVDCAFSGGANCIDLQSASIGEIRGCIFGDFATNAFCLFQNCAVVTIDSCYFENNGMTVAHLLFGAALNFDIVIVGCRFTNGVTAIEAAGGPGLRGATITGCVFRGNLTNGVRIDGIALQQSERVTIVGNSLIGTGAGIGILITALADHCVIVGNIVRSFGTNISDLGTADVVANNVSY